VSRAVVGDSEQSAKWARAFARLRLGALGIEPEAVSFERRGFALVPGPRRRLEEVGQAFVHGYRAALEDGDPAALERAIACVDAELRGFAYEGAAMGVALRDMLSPWRSSLLDRLLAGSGRAHVYMVHVGAGWALARLRRRPQATLRLDPLLRWLALDGYGFHQGYFRPQRHLRRGALPRGFFGYAARAFDQGLGRSLWFVEAAQPEPIAAAIRRFDERRRPDLWSGVALAAAYAGAADQRTLGLLPVVGAGYGSHLAQGAAFAAAAREHAGNPATHTELACRLLTGLPAHVAAALTDRAARDLPPDDVEPSYEIWRRRLRVALAASASERNATGGRLA
jgi:hypothetical protein